MSIVELIDKALAEDYAKEIPRGHLGMSSIGNPDKRTLWLKFRWSLPDVPAPRTLRIFEMGNILEDEVVSLLKLGGFEVWEKDPGTGKQFNFKYHGGHFGGSCDGVIRGIPGVVGAVVLEIKSASNKKATELQKLLFTRPTDSVALKEWNADYYGQVQCYMHNLSLKQAIFVVYNKDNSELVTALVDKEPYYWEGALADAERIITSDTPPESSYPNRDYYQIKKFKTEEYQAVYWGDRLPDVNCRNCRHAVPVVDETTEAKWYCKHHDRNLNLQKQVAACGDHNFLPSLMPAELVQIHEQNNAVEYKRPTGQVFFNASAQDHAKEVYSSLELVQHTKTGFKSMDDEFAKEVRAEFGGRLVDIGLPGEKHEAIF